MSENPPADEPTTVDVEVGAEEVKNIVSPKNMRLLRKFKGVDGVMRVLHTDKDKGICSDTIDDEIEDRRKRFGSNDFNNHATINLLKDFCICGLEAIQDPLIIILLIYTIVYICFGIKKHGIKGVWPERGTHLISIVTVVIFSAVTNFWPIKQNYVFSAAKNQVYSPQVDVVRNGEWQKIPISEVVVGDIVYLKPGDQVPADGLCIDGHSIHLDDLTSNNNNNDQNRRTLPNAGAEGGSQRNNQRVRVVENPFLFSGNMVADGYARMVVTAVEKSNNEENSQQPAQATWMTPRHVRELEELSATIGRWGKGFALSMFVWFFCRFCMQEIDDEEAVNDGDREADIVEFLVALVGMLGTSAVIVLTSSLESLVLAVNITLAYSMRSLLHKQVLIKRPSLCHQVASVDTICINKIGTLTVDSLEVKEFWFGLNDIEQSPTDLLYPSVIELLHQAIGLNITQPRSSSTFATSLSPTERAMFDWATRELKMDQKSLENSCTVLQIDPFIPVNKTSGVLINKKTDNTIHVHMKGAPEVILEMCSDYYGTGGTTILFNRSTRDTLQRTIRRMARKGLRCIAFAHRKTSIEEHFYSPRQQELTLIGVVGLENLVRTEMATAIRDLQRAGINLKLVTGDSILTATSIASRSGLLDQRGNQPGDIVVEGRKFEGWNREERLEKVDGIRVLAAANPTHKSLMVQTLKEKGRVVAYVGGALGDAQAIKEANVGICFGPATEGRAEIIKACSDIVIKDKNYLLVLEILKWGRGFYDSIQTYIQFLLTATFVDLVIDSAMTIFPNGFNLYYAVVDVSSEADVSSGIVAIPVFQLLWVKFILGLVAILSVRIRQPSDDLMSEPPRDLNEPLKTDSMKRNMVAQGLYQVIVLLAIHFRGKSLLKLNPNEKNTLIFNTYVLCQVFMLINAKLYDRKNIFQEMHRMKWFWGIIGFIIILQVIMVEFWKSFAGTARLDSKQWAWCFLIAAASTPLSWLLRYIPLVKMPYFKPKTE